MKGGLEMAEIAKEEVLYDELGNIVIPEENEEFNNMGKEEDEK